MRQRKIKNIEEKLNVYDEITVSQPELNKGNWKEIFENKENLLFLEIGSGKGQFISNYALSRPDWNFIGVEGQESVILRALEKVEEKEIKNVKFIIKYLNDVKECFDQGELDGIFLNFSDPWPKKKHAKRRLTYIDRLKEYAYVVKPGGFIAFKSDNDGLFDFTLEQISLGGFTVEAVTRDLHNSQFAKDNINTEYEDKFSSLGKNINYVRIRA